MSNVTPLGVGKKSYIPEKNHWSRVRANQYIFSCSDYRDPSISTDDQKKQNSTLR